MGRGDGCAGGSTTGLVAGRESGWRGAAGIDGEICRGETGVARAIGRRTPDDLLSYNVADRVAPIVRRTTPDGFAGGATDATCLYAG